MLPSAEKVKCPNCKKFFLRLLKERNGRGKMITYEVSFNRIEFIRFSIDAKSKSEVREIIKKAEWDLDTEKVDEIENTGFKIEEMKIAK